MIYVEVFIAPAGGWGFKVFEDGRKVTDGPATHPRKHGAGAAALAALDTLLDPGERYNFRAGGIATVHTLTHTRPGEARARLAPGRPLAPLFS